jgi:hypothetical protein
VYFGRLWLNEDRRPSKDWQEKKGLPFEKESKWYLQVATEDRIPAQNVDLHTVRAHVPSFSRACGKGKKR